MTQRARGAPARLAQVVRDGFVESVHSGHVAVATADGVLAGLGDPLVEIYPRSALKPLQAAAVLELLAPAGPALDRHAIAIASSSHAGSADQQTEAARVLALAGLDEGALQCPPAYPVDLDALRACRAPDRLSHNCSGKHAAFLLAQVVAGGDPARYREVTSAVQRQVQRTLEDVTGAVPSGPGVDGCGAPAWRLPLAALATGFARLADGGHLARVADAMRARPDLIGAGDAHDTLLMLADARVLAKRGAEAVLAAALAAGPRSVGVAVKVVDGGTRAACPVAAVVLAGLGARVPPELAEPPVFGGAEVHGRLEVDATVTETAQCALASLTQP